jgi:hypothetical protein
LNLKNAVSGRGVPEGRSANGEHCNAEMANRESQSVGIA